MRTALARALDLYALEREAQTDHERAHRSHTLAAIIGRTSTQARAILAGRARLCRSHAAALEKALPAESFRAIAQEQLDHYARDAPERRGRRVTNLRGIRRALRTCERYALSVQNGAAVQAIRELATGLQPTRSAA
jgi:hypothetical protein